MPGSSPPGLLSLKREIRMRRAECTHRGHPLQSRLWRAGAKRPVAALHRRLRQPPTIMLELSAAKIAVIGLGYVGLPVAVEFGKRYDTVGFDINQARVSELRQGRDHTLEVTAAELSDSTRLCFSAEESALAGRDVYIVTVPTPVDDYRRPDLTALRRASEAIGRWIKPGGIVVYESTVYPGATEEVCVPIIAQASRLEFNRDFFAGYSPERINPGDRQHRLSTILKITSGSTPEVADIVDRLYGSIVTAGTHKASSIRVAEAAKVIENTQRDVNIALINELALLFNRLGIDTEEVRAAAGTKWNFLPFRPGLVGGHCIGVDPYYLTHKAQEVGYHPEVILAGRRINDGMGGYVAAQLVKTMTRRKLHVAGARILVLGFTFKENCPDVRNTRVIDIVRELQNYNAEVFVHDPWADAGEVLREYGIRMIEAPEPNSYDGIVVAVAHRQFREHGRELVRKSAKAETVIFDVKNVLPREITHARL